MALEAKVSATSTSQVTQNDTSAPTQGMQMLLVSRNIQFDLEVEKNGPFLILDTGATESLFHRTWTVTGVRDSTHSISFATQATSICAWQKADFIGFPGVELEVWYDNRAKFDVLGKLFVECLVFVILGGEVLGISIALHNIELRRLECVIVIHDKHCVALRLRLE